MKSITSLESARNLPEKEPIRYKKRRKPDETVKLIPYFPKIVPVDLEDNTILLFEEVDGNMKQIGYDKDGAYKYDIQ